MKREGGKGVGGGGGGVGERRTPPPFLLPHSPDWQSGPS